MPRNVLWPVLAGFLFAALSVGAEEVTDIDRFQIWNDCAPVDLVVEDLSEDAGKIGLIKEEIENGVRLILDAKDIYGGSVNIPNPYFYVRVNIGVKAFSVEGNFVKVMIDQATGIVSYAETWDSGTVGSHPKMGKVLIQTTAIGRTFEFIDEYIRA